MRASPHDGRLEIILSVLHTTFSTGRAFPAGHGERTQAVAPGPTVPAPPFQVWLAGVIDEAVRRGFDRAFLDQALGGVQPLAGVIRADRELAGQGPGLDAYVAGRVTPDRIAPGREKMRVHRSTLDRVERWFGVQRRFVVAIWGAETGYGPYSGDIPVFQALATLVWEPRRAACFRAELFDALRIAQRGQIPPRRWSARGQAPWANRSSCLPATKGLWATEESLAP